MQPQASAESRKYQGRGRYLWRRADLPAPQPLRRPTTAFDTACQTLWPIDLHNHAAALLGASPEVIRGWRRANRPTPQWAIDKISAELKNRAEQIAAAIEALSKQKGRG